MSLERFFEAKALLDEHAIKGFLPPSEAELLFRIAAEQAKKGPLLEVGSYCGKSAVYLGFAADLYGTDVYTVDHHKGSEEHQKGEAYFDEELYDVSAKSPNTLPHLKKTLEISRLTRVVTPIVERSEILASRWQAPLALIFVDGGHGEQQAMNDCLLWAEHLMVDGVMAIHDIYEDPSQGGQAPYKAMLAVKERFGLMEVARVDSLVILTKPCQH